MGFFKRFTATVVANVDQAIATMENHDAVVEASLNELRRASAKSQARLRRVQADGARLQAKLTELGAAAERWSERAARYAESDEEKAIECLKRRRTSIEQRASCEQALSRHHALTDKLAASIDKIDKRHQELERTRTLMQTRERAADAVRVVDDAGRTVGSMNIDDTLERWEARIAEFEVDDDPEFDTSRFEQTFVDEELRAELQAELEALKQSPGEQS